MRPRFLSLLLISLSTVTPVFAQELDEPIEPAEPIVRREPLESNIEERETLIFDEPPARTRWNAGASLYFLQPFGGNDQAFVRLIGAGGTSPSTAVTDFDWSLKPAFDAWIGWEDPDGVGLRGRFFHFDHRSRTANGRNTGADKISLPGSLPDPKSSGSSLFASPGDLLNGGFGTDVLSFQSDLKIEAIDAEFTHLFDTRSGLFLFSAGARFIELRQGYWGTLRNSSGTATELHTVRFDQSFRAAGPTLGLEYRRAVSTSLNLLANVRGSLLVGVDKQSFRSTHNLNDAGGVLIPGGGSTALTDTSFLRSYSVLPITELELGFEYFLPVDREAFFLQATAIQQTYFGAGSASDPNANLALFGVRIGFGYQW